MKKRLLSLMAVLMVFSMAFAGCGQKAPTADSTQAVTSQTGKAEAVEINMYHSWSTDTVRGQALSDLINKFNTENNGKIKINVTVNPDFPAYQEKVKAMISADETPDIFHYNFNPNDLSRQQSGKLLDFTPYMDDQWKARFNAADLETLTIDGKLTSIPFEKAGALIYYNKALFAKAGINEFPTTWDGVFEAFDKLKASGVTPISLYTSDDAWHTTNLLTYLAASEGGTNMFNTGAKVNTPEMIKAAEYLKKAFKYTTGDALGANYSVSMNNFSSKKTAMIIDGPWLIGSLDPKMVNDVAIAPAPTFGNNKVTPGFTVTDAQTPWAAAKQDDKSKEEAIVSFMKYITSDASTKELTLKGSVFLSAKLNLTEADIKGAGNLLGQYITVFSGSKESLVNIQRNLTTAANSKLPSLLEGLALGKSSPEEFVKQLDAENQ